MADGHPTEPRIGVEQVSHRRGAKPGAWLLQWNIQNLGRESLTILAARLPHGQFRSPEQQFAPGYKVAPHETLPLEIEVACHEASGTVVENAFLILRVLWQDSPWRILARLRVSVDAHGVPKSVTELITTQRVGFSEQL